MDNTLDVEAVEKIIRGRGLSLSRVCREAGINEATFQRWKGGSHPKVTTYNAIADALRRLSAESESVQK